jgi:hypothetical protein
MDDFDGHALLSDGEKMQTACGLRGPQGVAWHIDGAKAVGFCAGGGGGGLRHGIKMPLQSSMKKEEKVKKILDSKGLCFRKFTSRRHSREGGNPGIQFHFQFSKPSQSQSLPP